MIGSGTLVTADRSRSRSPAGIALADASIVTLGLPSILVELDATVEGVALVLGVYTAVLAIALLPAAWLARRFGDAHLGAAGMALFALASVGCGAVDSLVPLLIPARRAGGRRRGRPGRRFRAARRLDGGPGRRMWVAASVFGIAVGPALGGCLTQAFSWRAIFLAQAPLLIPGLLVAIRAARAEVVPAAVGRTPISRPTACRRERRSPSPSLGIAHRRDLPGRPAARLGMEHRAPDSGPGGERVPISALAASRMRRCRDSRRRRLPAGRRRGRLPGAWRLRLVDGGAVQVLAGGRDGNGAAGALRRADA